MEGGSKPPEETPEPRRPEDATPGPETPAGPQPPPPPRPEAPAGPQSPAAPAYTGSVPPGGWQQPLAQRPGFSGGELASWGTRLGAWFIDGLVLLVPGVILFTLIVGSAIGLSGDNNDVAFGTALGAFLLFFLAFAIVALLYGPLLMMRQGEHNGQTWGKQALGIRVVRDNGEPFTFGPAAVREVVLKQLAVGVASSVIPFIPWFLDYFWPLWDDENRALHDMAASTHVVQA